MIEEYIYRASVGVSGGAVDGAETAGADDAFDAVRRHQIRLRAACGETIIIIIINIFISIIITIVNAIEVKQTVAAVDMTVATHRGFDLLLLLLLLLMMMMMMTAASQLLSRGTVSTL